MASQKKKNLFQSTSKNGNSADSRKTRQDDAMYSSSSDEADKISESRHCRSTSQEQFNRSRIQTEQTAASSSDTSRPEESHLANPFSFKHFLKTDGQTNYYNTGARPKVYTTSTTSPNNVTKDANVSYITEASKRKERQCRRKERDNPEVLSDFCSRNPTELPDFVQDHLVIEQCYLNHDTNQQIMLDSDNLPDFALNSVEQRQVRGRTDLKKAQSEILCDLPFDLTGTLDKGLPHKEHPTGNAACPENLDLPAFERPITEAAERPESVGFPFDLPLPLHEGEVDVNAATSDCSQSEEANVPKSLPDFLNDGPIHNRTTLSTDIGSNSGIDSIERRHLLENQWLRQELEMARKQINERTKRIQLLEAELASRKEVEQEETVHLEKAIEQVEDNLKRSTRRAVSAENTVASLKKEIKALTTEIALLRLENRELRARVGRSDSGVSPTNADQTMRRLATDLRTAASAAEVSLRQLMCGVDNLRVLASALENVDRIEDRTKDFLHDFDEDNAAGPAL